MLRTRFTELVGIEHPVVCGAMQWLSTAELVAAVSQAGGLGILSSLTLDSAETLRAEIRRTRALTDRPFAVNVTLLPIMRPVDYESYFAVSIEEGVRIIETAGRSPEPYLPQLRTAGVTVLHKCARQRDAVKAAKLGVDAVSIVGFEAGGNPGMEDISTLIRVPLAADALDIPVLAAGGIADGRGLAAALALGASAVVMGTRFMLSRECPMHPVIKERLIQAGEADTELLLRSINNPERVLKTGWAQTIREMEAGGAGLEELRPQISGLKGRDALQNGLPDAGAIVCGQAIGMIDDAPPVAVVMTRIISQAMDAGRHLKDSGLMD
jgi:NADH:quinone reductase (non-electrogenic)